MFRVLLNPKYFLIFWKKYFWDVFAKFNTWP